MTSQSRCNLFSQKVRQVLLKRFALIYFVASLLKVLRLVFAKCQIENKNQAAPLTEYSKKDGSPQTFSREKHMNNARRIQKNVVLDTWQIML